MAATKSINIPTAGVSVSPFPQAAPIAAYERHADAMRRAQEIAALLAVIAQKLCDLPGDVQTNPDCEIDDLISLAALARDLSRAPATALDGAEVLA